MGCAASKNETAESVGASWRRGTRGVAASFLNRVRPQGQAWKPAAEGPWSPAVERRRRRNSRAKRRGAEQQREAAKAEHAKHRVNGEVSNSKPEGRPSAKETDMDTTCLRSLPGDSAPPSRAPFLRRCSTTTTAATASAEENDSAEGHADSEDSESETEVVLNMAVENMKQKKLRGEITAPSPLCSSCSRSTAVPSPSGGADDLYERIRVVGQGTYGIVYEAVNRNTGERVALKKLKIDDDDDHGDQMGIPTTAIREIVLLRELKHRNIVSLMSIFHSGTQLWLVFELCAHDLKFTLRTEKEKSSLKAMAKGLDPQQVCVGLAIPNVKALALQLLEGVAHCHERRILHRDLKPQNLLLDEMGTSLKIADFGLARSFEQPVTRPSTPEVVTLWYRAPELLLGNKVYGSEIDMWSVGCIIAEMITGRPLFPGDSEIGTLVKIFQLLGTPDVCDSEGIELTRLPFHQKKFPNFKINRDESLRKAIPTDDDDAIDVIKRLLALGPQKRPSAKEIVSHNWFAELRSERDPPSDFDSEDETSWNLRVPPLH